MPKTRIANAKQVVYGTPQTVSTTGLSNTSFGEPANQIRVTITPKRTGRFKIYGDCTILTSPNTAAAIESRISLVSGAGGTVEQINQGVTSPPTANTMLSQHHLVTTARLLAGVTYIFGVEARNLSGAGTYNVQSGATAHGNSITAEEL